MLNAAPRLPTAILAAAVSLLSGCAAVGPRPPRAEPGVAVASGLGAEPSLAVNSDEAGSMVVAYTRAERSGTTTIVARKYAPDGAPGWGEGLTLAEGARDPGDLIVERGSGDWYAAWKERTDIGWRRLARRFSEPGRAAWDAPVVVGALATPDSDTDYTAAADGSLLLAWNDAVPSRRTVFLSLARIAPDGAVTPLLELGRDAAEANYQLPKLDWDEAGGGAFLSYRKVDGGDRGIQLRRLSSMGEPLWPGELSVYDGGGYKSPALHFGDGRGGLIMAWEDGRSGGIDVYAQRVSSTGAVLWSERGVPIAAREGNQWSPAMAPDGKGGVFVAWLDSVRASRSVVRAQHLDLDGKASFPREGVQPGRSSESQAAPMVSSDGVHGAFVCWYEERFGDYGIYCQRLSSDGKLLWDPEGVPVAVSSSQKTGLRLVADGIGGALAVWKSRTADGWEVRAQRVGGSGKTGW